MKIRSIVQCILREPVSFGPIVWHKRQAFGVNSAELCRVQALDYARLILDFYLHLAQNDNGFCFIEGHRSNIFQRGCAKPVWTDLGSIRPLKDAAGVWRSLSASGSRRNT